MRLFFLPPSLTLIVTGAVALSCGGAAPAALHSNEVALARGGELADEHPERAIKIDRDTVSVWGITEVPETARLQLAYSGVDAITRAELIKAVRVRVQGLDVHAETGDPQKRTVMIATAESVSGVLDQAGPLPHGWARVQRGERVVLRLWARLTVPRAQLEAALRAPLADTGRDASEFVSGLELAQETPQ